MPGAPERCTGINQWLDCAQHKEVGDAMPDEEFALEDTLAKGGEMGALVRSLDWSSTPLR
jgi:hypothetical protein